MNNIDLHDLGLSSQHLQEAARYGSHLHLARVSVQHRDLYRVITASGEIQAVVSGKLSHAADMAADYPAVGDWVLVDRTEDRGGTAIIHQIITRKSCFARKAAGTGGERQIIAANIDTVFICMSLNNDFNLRRAERYLAIAWDSGAIPVIVLTKADLRHDLDVKLRELESIAMGVDVVVTSSLSEDGYGSILKYVRRGKTVAFIGSSGVGKSTLINRLMGAEVLATSETRDDDRGRHTTTFRQLLILPDRGVVIDTPGLRELQIAGADLAQSFADIEALAEQCRFRDCRHQSEPGCAVRASVEDGRISAKRLENYQKLQREALFEERKASMTATQVQKQKTIDMMGSLDGQKQVLKYHRKKK